MKTCEGEFRNNVKNGFVKIYGESERLVFEGKHLAGMRIGQGTEYFPNGQIKAKGEFFETKYHGYMQ